MLGVMTNMKSYDAKQGERRVKVTPLCMTIVEVLRHDSVQKNNLSVVMAEGQMKD